MSSNKTKEEEIVFGAEVEIGTNLPSIGEGHRKRQDASLPPASKVESELVKVVTPGSIAPDIPLLPFGNSEP